MDTHMDTDEAPAAPITQHQPPAAESDFIAAASAAADYDSSDLSSSSDADSDSDSDESSKPILDIIAEGDDDMEDGGTSSAITSRNEILHPLIPAVSIDMLPAAQTTQPLGTIYSVVDNTVIIESACSGEHTVLDVDTIVAFPDRSVLGQIFEVFGPVARPMYSVRFNEATDIDRIKCIKGAEVVYAVGMANIVATDKLRSKGYDASNEYDEEVDENEMEFSDDEKELAHRQKLKARLKQQKMAQREKQANPMPLSRPQQQRPQQQPQQPARQLQSYGDLYDPDLGF
ncbi:hypothetical protein FBU59_002548 [Linderina macrospora]|uniref:Uncharacterized protein n=1 Tax=Linderina macrospora TaxID=4868 RepID=A0ACC1JAU5_9FUNG|nr:hypothetical protein FBU59_002548 [Linderina macrospora]